MTKTKKTILMTLLSSMLIFCAALGAILSTPLSSASADSVDYTNWTRTAIQAGDTLANKYILIDKTILSTTADYIVFDRVVTPPASMGRIFYNPTDEESGAGFPPHSLAGDAGDGAFVEFPLLQSTDTFEVYYITPYTIEVVTQFSNPLTQTSTVHTVPDGYFFITEPEDGTTGGETTTPDTDDTYTQIDSSNCTATFLSEGVNLFGSYLTVPESTQACAITFTGTSYAIQINSPTDVNFGGVALECYGVTERYGEKAYMYDFTKETVITNGTAYHAITADKFIIKGMSVGAEDCYILTVKSTSTTPDTGDDTTQTPLPDDTEPDKEYTEVLTNRTGKKLEAGETLYGKFLFISEATTITVKSAATAKTGTLEFTNDGSDWNWTFTNSEGTIYTQKISDISVPEGYAKYNGIEGYVFDFSETVEVCHKIDGENTSVYYLNELWSVESVESDGDVYIFNRNTTEEPTDFDKFLEDVSGFFQEHTGVVLGSTGALVVIAFLLFLLFRK